MSSKAQTSLGKVEIVKDQNLIKTTAAFEQGSSVYHSEGLYVSDIHFRNPTSFEQQFKLEKIFHQSIALFF